MLGWVLRRGENAPDAGDGGDTTQIDQPDTPAPVFAARAFKSAIFGTPTRKDSPRDKVKANTESTELEQPSATPSKPQGILLTPGTGTTRRKRVSFNHNALSTTKTISPNSDTATNKRSRVSAALAKANRNSNTEKSKKNSSRQAQDESEEEWEEEDSEGDFCTQDMTLDLNEPHSQSGKYWKDEFQKYQQEARAEMDKLLKYKHLAKSYAREKDAEAIQLAERLKEEQERVIAMEKKISESANQMASKQKDASASETSELLATLTQQTALAAQYRHRVQELEAKLEDLLHGREEEGETRSRRSGASLTSPNTQKTLLETNRELRRARSQLKELDALRKQVSSLKAQLKIASRRDATPDDRQNDESISIELKELKSQLKLVKEESAKKDEEIRLLKEDFQTFRSESEAHDADSKAVLERAHTKISNLKNEVKALKAASSMEKPRPRSWHPKSEDDHVLKEDSKVGRVAKDSALMSGARRSLDFVHLDQPTTFETSTGAKHQTLREKYQEGGKSTTSQNETIVSQSPPDVLADRPNLERPRWQPFVPRSPRNRAYLGEDTMKRIQHEGDSILPTPNTNVDSISDLPALAKSLARSKRSGPAENGDVKVDLLQDRFARLGGPDAGQEKAKKVAPTTTTKGSLPPDRRAAARAKIEERMAAKKALRRDGVDKENVRP